MLETAGRVPNPDLKIIVPNGFVKLVIPVGNGLIGQRAGYSRLSKANQVTVVGVSDARFTVDAEADAPSSIITVEFSPSGAYHFFNIRHSEIRNRILFLDDILGRTARELSAMLTFPSPESALGSVRLRGRLRKAQGSPDFQMSLFFRLLEADSFSETPGCRF